MGRFSWVIHVGVTNFCLCQKGSNVLFKSTEAIHAFLFIRKWFIRKLGYRGQKFKKVEGYNASALTKLLSTRSKNCQFQPFQQILKINVKLLGKNKMK